MTTKRKKDSAINFHKFELIKYFQELNEHQRKLEEDLKTFVQDKNLKSVQDEEEKLATDRSDYQRGIYTQVDGFKSLVSSLKLQLGLFEQLSKEGKKSLATKEWDNRKREITSVLQDLKQDLKEREEFILSEDFEIPQTSIAIDTTDFNADSFIENLPNNVPG